MFTRLYLWIKNFPKWLRTVKSTYPVLYVNFWAFNLLVLLTLINYLYVRSDYFYFLTFFLYPAFMTFYQLIANFSYPTSKKALGHNENLSQTSPIWILLLLVIIHVPLIIQGKYPVYSDVYDEYFTYMLSILFIIAMGLIASKIYGKLRPVFLILLYFLSITAAVIAFVLAVTI
ncbi:MAG: hypothetical protein AB7U79_03380 [Candidatus Izemoplasmatales bacterium]